MRSAVNARMERGKRRKEKREKRGKRKETREERKRKEAPREPWRKVTDERKGLSLQRTLSLTWTCSRSCCLTERIAQRHTQLGEEKRNWRFE